MLRNRAIASAKVCVDKFDIIASILKLHPKDGWTLWEDKDGNKLKIAKDKSIKIFKTKVEPNTTFDVLKKARPIDIAKKSYWALAIFGKSDTILCFMGYDGILRGCYFVDKIWIENISPMLLGIQILKKISSGFTNEIPKKIWDLKIKYPKEFIIESAWTTGYPSNNKKLQENILCHLRI